MPEPDFHNLTWERSEYLVSTSKHWAHIESLRKAFASPQCYWTNALPPKAMRKLVDNSLCFSLVHFPPSGATALVGFARIITDYATFAYLTDVYVLPEHQGKGLGRWLIRCIPDVLDQMPDLRRWVLLTSRDGEDRETGKEADGVRFYRETVGMEPLTEKLVVCEKKGRGNVV